MTQRQPSETPAPPPPTTTTTRPPLHTAAPVALLATGVSSLAAKRYTGSGINAVRWFLLFLLGVVIQIAYQLLMPK